MFQGLFLFNSVVTFVLHVSLLFCNIVFPCVSLWQQLFFLSWLLSSVHVNLFLIKQFQPIYSSKCLCSSSFLFVSCLVLPLCFFYYIYENNFVSQVLKQVCMLSFHLVFWWFSHALVLTECCSSGKLLKQTILNGYNYIIGTSLLNVQSIVCKK